MFNVMRSGNKTWQHGISLIEVVMALLFTTIVIIGGVAYYQTSLTSEKTESTILEVMSLLSAIDRVYSSNQNFKGISSDVVARTCDLPASFIVSEPDGKMGLRTPNGEKILIKESVIDGKENSKFFQIIFAVPWRMCTAMGRLGTRMKAGGIYTVYSAEEIQAYCDAAKGKGTAKDKVQIVYTFH